MFVRIVLHQTFTPAHFLHPQYLSSTVVPEDIYIFYLVLYTIDDVMLDISPCWTETVRCTGIISFFKRCNSVEIEGQDTKYLILIVEAMLHISYPVSRVAVVAAVMCADTGEHDATTHQHFLLINYWITFQDLVLGMLHYLM